MEKNFVKVQRSEFARHLEGVVDSHVQRLSLWHPQIQLILKETVAVPIQVVATFLHLPPRYTGEMLEVEVTPSDLQELHPLHG